MGLLEDPKPSWVTALRPQTGLELPATMAPTNDPFFFTPAVDVCWIQRIQRSSLQNPPGIPARPEPCSFPVLQISNTPRPCQIQIKLIPLFGEYMMYMRQNMTFHSLSKKNPQIPAIQKTMSFTFQGTVAMSGTSIIPSSLARSWLK